MTSNLLAASGGFVLGIIFFGGLWLTVQKGLVSTHPALLFLSSSLLRTAIVIGGFIFIAAGNLERLLFAVGGFVAAKVSRRHPRTSRSRIAYFRKGGEAMHLSSNQVILWQSGFLKLNLTIVTTLALMMLLAIGSWLITRRLSTGITISRWQSMLEIIVTMARQQIGEVGLEKPEKYLPYIATLFLFIGTANLCTFIPGYAADRLALDHDSPCAFCLYRRAALRHR